MEKEIERILEEVNDWNVEDVEQLIFALKVVVDALNEDLRFRANQK